MTLSPSGFGFPAGGRPGLDASSAGGIPDRGPPDSGALSVVPVAAASAGCAKTAGLTLSPSLASSVFISSLGPAPSSDGWSEDDFNFCIAASSEVVGGASSSSNVSSSLCSSSSGLCSALSELDDPNISLPDFFFLDCFFFCLFCPFFFGPITDANPFATWLISRSVSDDGRPLKVKPPVFPRLILILLFCFRDILFRIPSASSAVFPSAFPKGSSR